MPRADDGRRIGHGSTGKGTKPAVGGTVRVKDVNRLPMARQPGAQDAKIGRLFSTYAKGNGRNAVARSCVIDRRLGRRQKRYSMAALQHSASFAENADFLASPASGVLGVDDRERPHGRLSEKEGSYRAN